MLLVGDSIIDVLFEKVPFHTIFFILVVHYFYSIKLIIEGLHLNHESYSFFFLSSQTIASDQRFILYTHLRPG